MNHKMCSHSRFSRLNAKSETIMFDEYFLVPHFTLIKRCHRLPSTFKTYLEHDPKIKDANVASR